MPRATDERTLIIRHYGLLPPLDWDEGIDLQLRLANDFWNQLVEIERENRRQYAEIVNSSPEVADLSAQIAVFETEREELIAERKRRRAAVRSKAKADTGSLEHRLGELRSELRPLYEARKKLMPQVRKSRVGELKALEIQRREKVKAARQAYSAKGLFWSNYNAVAASYDTARAKALKEGAQLRFRRFDGSGRLVNQLQSGPSVDDLLNAKHSQVSLRIDGPLRSGRRAKAGCAGILTVTAFTGRDSDGKSYRRNVRFPIRLHRPLPEGASVKSVAVSISEVAGEKRYAVTFTCRADQSDEPVTGTAAAGVNLGWKRVTEGLRVATAVFSTGEVNHLVLENRWLARMERVRALQAELDEAVNDFLPALKSALDAMPLWSEEIQVEGIPSMLHRRLSGVLRAPRLSAASLLGLLFEIKVLWEEEPNAMALLHPLAEGMEAWRKQAKRKHLEMMHLREKLLAERKNRYRVFAKELADKAGMVILDDTSYREAARLSKADGEENPLTEQARSNRVLVAPFELRLAIDQSFGKRGGKIERYGGKINACQRCGSSDLSGELVKTCGGCGAVFDVDENAASNLLATITPKSNVPPPVRERSGGAADPRIARG